MMVLERDAHETLLQELLNPELEHSRRTEILQELRVDRSQITSTLEETTSARDKLHKDNQDLIISNSQLFRQLGVVQTGEPVKEDPKTISETITLDDLGK